MSECRWANPPRWGLFLTICGLHVLLVLGPLGYSLVKNRFSKPKEIAFRVKLGGDEPSHAPEIGPPERKRPTPGAPAPETPAAPEPAPEVKPDPKPEPKPEPPKPEVAPKPKQKLPAKPKPKKKAEKKPTKPKPDKKAAAKKTQKPDAKAKAAKNAKRNAKTQAKAKPKPETPSVYTDPRAKDFSPEHGFGGTNTNINVPIGLRDRGQALGKVDGRTPAGGATKEEEAYWQRLIPFFAERWTPPPGVLITEDTAVVVELQFDDRGKVLARKIVSPSPNPAVTESVRRMLNSLDYIPAPPSGGTTITLKMMPDL